MGGGVVHLDGGVDPLHLGRRDDPKVELGLVEGALEHFRFAQLVHGLEQERRPGRRRILAELGGEECEGGLEGHGGKVAL